MKNIKGGVKGMRKMNNEELVKLNGGGKLKVGPVCTFPITPTIRIGKMLSKLFKK